MTNPPGCTAVIAKIRRSSVVDTVTTLRTLRHLVRGLALGPRIGGRGAAMAKIANERIANNNLFLLATRKPVLA